MTDKLEYLDPNEEVAKLLQVKEIQEEDLQPGVIYSDTSGSYGDPQLAATPHKGLLSASVKKDKKTDKVYVKFSPADNYPPRELRFSYPPVGELWFKLVSPAALKETRTNKNRYYIENDYSPRFSQEDFKVTPEMIARFQMWIDSLMKSDLTAWFAQYGTLVFEKLLQKDKGIQDHDLSFSYWVIEETPDYAIVAMLKNYQRCHPLNEAIEFTEKRREIWNRYRAFRTQEENEVMTLGDKLSTWCEKNGVPDVQVYFQEEDEIVIPMSALKLLVSKIEAEEL